MRQARGAGADVLAAGCGFEHCRRGAVAALPARGTPAQPAIMNPASPSAQLLRIPLMIPVLVQAVADAIAPTPGGAARPAAAPRAATARRRSRRAVLAMAGHFTCA
jgi:hypothetical protein